MKSVANLKIIVLQFTVFTVLLASAFMVFGENHRETPGEKDGNIVQLNEQLQYNTVTGACLDYQNYSGSYADNASQCLKQNGYKHQNQSPLNFLRTGKQSNRFLGQ